LHLVKLILALADAAFEELSLLVELSDVLLQSLVAFLKLV